VILNLALDDLAAGQADAKRQQPAPSLMQRFQVDELGAPGNGWGY